MSTSRIKPLRRQRQSGAVALVLGLALVVLIGFAGLAIDLGRFFVVKSELQNAMDACALAAASQLRPGQNNAAALTKARAYGQLAASQNKANFQTEAITVSDDHITFSDRIDFSTGADNNTAKYVKCTYPLSGLLIYFMQVLNPERSTQTVSATAVAALVSGGAACAAPVGVCIGSGGTPANNFGLTVGQWLTAKSGSKYGTGNFGWIDFTPPGGGTSELADTLTGTGQCELTAGIPVGEQGNRAKLEEAWNSRFGWYKKGGGAPDISNAPPDVTGYAYSVDSNWPLGSNAYAGTVAGAVNYVTASASHLAYQGDTPKGIPSNNYTASTPEQHSQATNRRLVSAPVVDCNVWNTSGSAQPLIESWACVLMLNPIAGGNPKSPEVWDAAKVEFLGLSTDADNPCVKLIPVLGQ